MTKRSQPTLAEIATVAMLLRNHIQGVGNHPLFSPPKKENTMIKKLLSKGLCTLATRAVESAEVNFGAGKGIAKKRFAVNFILARLPFPPFVREVLDDLLIEIIDIAVESAHARLSAQLASL